MQKVNTNVHYAMSSVRIQPASTYDFEAILSKIELSALKCQVQGRRIQNFRRMYTKSRERRAQLQITATRSIVTNSFVLAQYGCHYYRSLADSMVLVTEAERVATTKIETRKSASSD